MIFVEKGRIKMVKKKFKFDLIDNLNLVFMYYVILV